MSSIKDTQTKLENQIKDLTKQCKEQKEKMFEWESKYAELEAKAE